MGDENNPANAVKLGDFPYPLTKGPKESRYLTWLRNHSNYMTTRGFLDYLQDGRGAGAGHPLIEIQQQRGEPGID